MGPAFLCSTADRRSPLQEGCLKSKLPACHLLLRRSVSQQQNQQKQLFIPFDVGFEVTPPPPLCPPTNPSSTPPLSRPSPPARCIFYSKETRSLKLPRKGGFFFEKSSDSRVITRPHITLWRTERACSLL